jgi:hypothetical protein
VRSSGARTWGWGDDADYKPRSIDKPGIAYPVFAAKRRHIEINCGAVGDEGPPPPTPPHPTHDRAKLDRRGDLFAKYVISFVGLDVFVLAVNGALEIWISYRNPSVNLMDALSILQIDPSKLGSGAGLQ